MSDNQNVVRLKGGQTYLTSNSTSTYKVLSGSVLVYIVPVLNGKAGRRLLLNEVSAGNSIPSFYTENDEGVWSLCYVALDVAEVEEVPNSMNDELAKEFVETANITNLGETNFADIIMEEYQRNSITEENFIFASQVEEEESVENNLRLIYSVFEKGGMKKSTTPETGNHIYDATAFVCDNQKIEMAPFSKIVAANGRRFKFQDVARISNFVTREVMLTPGWFKQDSGPMVAFLEKGHKAIGLLPNRKGYLAYNPSTHETFQVDEEFAEQLDPHAQSVYRPFPNKKLGILDVLKFAFQEITARDAIRFGVLSLLGTLIGILLPILNQQIYDNYIPMSLSMGIIQIGLVLIAANIGSLTFTIVKNLTSTIAFSRIGNSVFAAACERLFNLPSSFFRDYQSADLSERVIQIEQLVNAISNVGVSTVISALFSILYVVQMFAYAPSLALIGIGLMVVVMGLVLFMGWLQTKNQRRLIDSSAQANSKMYQYLMGIEKVRGAGAEEHAMHEYLKPYVESKQISMHNGRLGALNSMLSIFISSGFSILFYIQMVNGGSSMSVGQFSAFLAAFGSFSAAMLAIASAVTSLNTVKPMLDRVRPVLEAIPEYSADAEVPGDLEGDIEISNVDFAYEEGSDLILKDISVHIKKGEYIGIVGASGGGKSTLMKLLLGFEKPTSGRIYYDGKDIDGVDKRELRKKFGVVLQDGKLIGGTIFENMTITAPSATMKDAERVAEEVGLAEDIKHMPMGMHTVLAEMGGAISGGQQQRILIARAIMANPNVLFFDEATSALDNTTQKMVTDSLEKLNATRLVIAHRLSTIKECDRILVLNHGQIVETGNYDELMEQKGLFYDLAKRQMA